MNILKNAPLNDDLHFGASIKLDIYLHSILILIFRILRKCAKKIQ